MVDGTRECGIRQERGGRHERSRGRVASGEWIVPDVEALIVKLRGGDWIAGDPVTHPDLHLREACNLPGSPCMLHEAALGGPALPVMLEWSHPGESWRDLRDDACALIGGIAEPTSYARQKIEDDVVEFLITAGMFSDDTSFTSHGHLLPRSIGGPGGRSLRAHRDS